MKSPCPSVMVVSADGSKWNGGIQSRHFSLKVHNRKTCFKVQWACMRKHKNEQYHRKNDSLSKLHRLDNLYMLVGMQQVRRGMIARSPNQQVIRSVLTYQTDALELGEIRTSRQESLSPLSILRAQRHRACYQW